MVDYQSKSMAKVQLDEHCFTQLIDGDGMFNVAGFDTFSKAVKLRDCGDSYTVVSIMGPQSSGKSTLLNHLFRTNFREMDAFKGRSQATKGIWMAKCAEIEPCTLVMDLEGSDGRERGEDDTAFEKQSALFALAISDIVLINIWYHDVGREQAANKPLLKTVFLAMMRLFHPRKTTLLFVIRDLTITPLEILECDLREDIQKIWDNVPKPEAHKETPLSEFFNVEVMALSSYIEKKEQFKEQVAILRQRFYSSAPGGLVGDRHAVVPASEFSFSAQDIWKSVIENKDLDLPAHKVMVATVCCQEIADGKSSLFAKNEEWIELEKAVQSGPVSGFGNKLGIMLEKCLSEYDMEVTYFDEGVRTATRQSLEDKLLNLVQPAYQSMLGHLRSKILDDFKEAFDKALNGGEGFAVAALDCTQSFVSEFDKGCEDAAIKQANWDPSKVRDKLRRDIEAHVTSVRAVKLSEITADYQGKLNIALAEPLENLLDAASSETWPAINHLLRRETSTALSGYSAALSVFGMDANEGDQMLANLKNYARNVVETKARDESGRVLIHMKDRFAASFSYDSNSMPWVWSGEEDIPAIRKTACSASLKLLSCMAVLRLDDDADSIENILSLALMDPIDGGESMFSKLFDPLASSTWKEVPASKTLITPVRCKSLWKQFEKDIATIVLHAQAAQEVNKRNNNRLPPPCAIAAIVVLGFNEFMTLLRNPLYLLVILVGFLLIKDQWAQLDIPGEFRNGALPGLISLATKILGSFLKKLADEGQNLTAPVPERNEVESNHPHNETSAIITSTENGVEHSESFMAKTS